MHDIAPPHPRYTQLTQIAAEQKALADSVRVSVTDKWGEMQAETRA